MSCEVLKKLALPADFGDDVARLTVEEQQIVLQYKELECRCRMESIPLNLTGIYCNRTWDRIMCWDDAPAGTTVYQHCPGYINNFYTDNLASRTCLENGTWDIANSRRKVGWTNYTACMDDDDDIEDVTIPPTTEPFHIPFLLKHHLDNIQLMCDIGYGISLILLILAFIIILYFRKLRCMRNVVHLNLFAAFILRALVSLIRDLFMVGGLGFPEDVFYNNVTGISQFKEGSHWECRLFFSVFYYAVAASYTWIFIDALYLYMKIFVTVFSGKMKIWWYFVLGWSFPCLIMLCLCLSRYYFDNSYCWNTFNIQGLVWIFKGPIMLTVVINFVLFVSTICILNTKLKAPQCSNSTKTRVRKLARSIFFLVPTFGVYFILFTIPYHHINETLDFVVLAIEMFFNSFQGSLLAIVMCFINAEVRHELKRFWYRLKNRLNNRRRISSSSSRHEWSRSSRSEHFIRGDRSRIGSVDEDMLKVLTNAENLVNKYTPLRSKSIVSGISAYSGADSETEVQRRPSCEEETILLCNGGLKSDRVQDSHCSCECYFVDAAGIREQDNQTGKEIQGSYPSGRDKLSCENQNLETVTDIENRDKEDLCNFGAEKRGQTCCAANEYVYFDVTDDADRT